jgi:hypothetical protein
MIDVQVTVKKTEGMVKKPNEMSWLSDFSQDFVYTCILADCVLLCGEKTTTKYNQFAITIAT